jgi:hypothetical protein
MNLETDLRWTDGKGNWIPNRWHGVTEVSESTKCVRSIKFWIGKICTWEELPERGRMEISVGAKKHKMYQDWEGASAGLTSERSDGWVRPSSGGF